MPADETSWLTYDEIARICGVSREEVFAMFASDMWRWVTGSLATPLPVAEVPLYLTSDTEWRMPSGTEEERPA